MRDYGNVPLTQRPEGWQASEEELRRSLAIGIGDGNEYLLLCPVEDDPSCEWKAWAYDYECGFESYDSLIDFMESGEDI